MYLHTLLQQLIFGCLSTLNIFYVLNISKLQVLRLKWRLEI